MKKVTKVHYVKVILRERNPNNLRAWRDLMMRERSKNGKGFKGPGGEQAH